MPDFGCLCKICMYMFANFFKCSVSETSKDSNRLFGGWRINSTFWPGELSWWIMFRLLSLVFRTCAKNLGKQIWVYYSELTDLRCSSGRHITSLAEETGDHLLRSASSLNKNFRWIWIVFEDSHGGLLFCFGLIRIDPWLVTCDDLINVFWSTAIVFFLRRPTW